MARFLKSGLILALVVGVLWLGVIIWWQESRRMPTGTDIALYLFVLPLALIAGFFVMRKVVRGAGAKAAAPETALEQSAAPAGPGLARASVIATAIATAHGDTGDAMQSALRDQKRPQMDETLIDTQGFPAFSARVADIDTRALREHAKRQGHDASPWDDEMLRAQALLERVLEPLLRLAASHPRNAIEAGAHAQRSMPPALQVDIFVPETWPPEVQEAVRGKLQAQIAPVWASPAFELKLHAVAAGIDLTDWIDRHAEMPAPDAAPSREVASDGLFLLAACDSLVGETAVQRSDQAGHLLKSNNQQGRAVGEAAAGLLLAAASSARDFPPAGQTRVSATRRQNRQTPAHARQASAEQVLPELTRALLTDAEVSADDIKVLASDADHRGSRPFELATLAGELFPGLDPSADCLSIGGVCGETGVATQLLSVALACQASADLGAPAVVALIDHPLFRAALLVEPAAGDSAQPQTAS